MAEFGLRKFVAISSGLMFYFFVGIEETVMTSYFSLEASKRGLDIVQIGLCFCMMDVSTFLFSFLAMFTITPSRERLFCVSGRINNHFASILFKVKKFVFGPIAILSTFFRSQNWFSKRSQIPIRTQLRQKKFRAADKFLKNWSKIPFLGFFWRRLIKKWRFFRRPLSFKISIY